MDEKDFVKAEALKLDMKELEELKTSLTESSGWHVIGMSFTTANDPEAAGGVVNKIPLGFIQDVLPIMRKRIDDKIKEKKKEFSKI